MPKAALIQDNNNERIYQLQNGKIITIKIDDYSEITYWEDGVQIGHDEEFVFFQDEFNNSRYLLARMYVPIKGQGLGRATLEFFTEYFDASAWARINDGIELPDGSHLTEDAPSFVDKMIDEGLLEDNRDKGFEGEYDLDE